MYMFLIRPQQKRVKEQQALVRSLAAGDEVLLNSGIHGVVKEVEDIMFPDSGEFVSFTTDETRKISTRYV